MIYNLILEEFDRKDAIKDDGEFKQFYYSKLKEWEIESPDDLEVPCEFLTELCEEWVDNIDIDQLIEIYDDIDGDDINGIFLNELRKIKIKKHSSAIDKRKGKIYRKKMKIK